MFVITSREEVERIKPGIPDTPYAIISISDPGTPYPKIHQTKFLRGVLRLRFHDIERPWEGYRIFNKTHAKKILLFMINHWDIPLMIVHCEQGISRSSATAAALSRIVDGDDSWVFSNKEYSPNRRVYRGILEIWKGMVKKTR